MRVRYVSGALDYLLKYPNIFISEERYEKGKWKNKFSNNNPIELEIGMGKGKFILDKAIANPDINYIGFDKDISIVYKALNTILNKATNGLPNLLILCLDATDISNVFEAGEVDKIYLNFSDPWPKARHEKRRLTGPNLFRNILDITKGSIEFKTDNRHLFEYSIKEFNKLNLEIVNLSLNLHEDDINVITTEYEDKFSKLGNPIYYCEVRKKRC